MVSKVGKFGNREEGGGVRTEQRIGERTGIALLHHCNSFACGKPGRSPATPSGDGLWRPENPQSAICVDILIRIFMVAGNCRLTGQIDGSAAASALASAAHQRPVKRRSYVARASRLEFLFRGGGRRRMNTSATTPVVGLASAGASRKDFRRARC